MTTFPRLVLLTDRTQLPTGRALVGTVAECLDAGLTHVIIRELDESMLGRTALAAALTELGATVISAREPLFGTSGVHLAGDQVVPADLPLPWGRSCHSANDVQVAAAAGASWAILSPFALSPSKPGYGPALPASEFGSAARAGIPVLALGGIDTSNAADAIAAGADGLAVMGSVMRAARPGDVIRELREIVEDAPW